jgi:hypothetical protein
MFQNMGSLRSSKLKCQIKVDGEISPLYGKPHEIIFDKKTSITCNQFIEKYEFYNIIFNPKTLRIGKD